MAWHSRKLIRWKFGQMKRRNPQTFRQNLGIFLLENIPHPEIDCGSDGEGIMSCSVPSARGYVCRRHCVDQMRKYEAEMADAGIL